MRAKPRLLSGRVTITRQAESIDLAPNGYLLICYTAVIRELLYSRRMDPGGRENGLAKYCTLTTNQRHPATVNRLLRPVTTPLAR